MIFCRDCQDSQLEVIATRVVGKTPVCDVHLRSRMGLPKKIEPEEAKDMGKWKRTDATTIEAIRKDATAGMGLSAIAEKNGVSWPTAKRYAGNGKRHAGGGKNGEAHSPRRAHERRLKWQLFGATLDGRHGCSLERARA